MILLHLANIHTTKLNETRFLPARHYPALDTVFISAITTAERSKQSRQCVLGIIQSEENIASEKEVARDADCKNSFGASNSWRKKIISVCGFFLCSNHGPYKN